MGLDQNAYIINKANILNRFSYREDGNSGQDEIMYWRKNHILNRWMYNLYTELKIGKSLSEMSLDERRKIDFNCQILFLTPEDLNRLEQDIQSGKMKDDWITERRKGGILYDEDEEFQKMEEEEYQEYDSYYKKYDLDFVHDARIYIANGYAVYYQPWW